MLEGELWYTRVANVSHRYENLEGVMLVRFPNTALHVSLYFCFTLLSVTEIGGQKCLLMAYQGLTL